MHSCVLFCVLFNFGDVDDVVWQLPDRTGIREAEMSAIVVLEFAVHHVKLRVLLMGDVTFGFFPLNDLGDT